MLQDVNIVVGVTGGIAAYKACGVVRLFKKAGANVDVVMTENACKFVTPLTFETLSSRPVAVDTFTRSAFYEVEHISLAKKADVFVVCPATANLIGKFANGIADDMLTTTLLAAKCPVIIAPAMNVNMYTNAAVTKNIETLKQRGVKIVEAGEGFLACGDIGKGRMAEPEEIFDFTVKTLFSEKTSLEGKKILITAGATLERLDCVRYISNFSSGKMAAEIAAEALRRGAKVTLISARHTAVYPALAKVKEVETVSEMLSSTLELADSFDAFVMAAAPCDYRPLNIFEEKIKSETLTLELVKNPDIAEELGKIKGMKPMIVFAAESDENVDSARAKLIKKHADVCIMNDVKNNAVFGTDRNKITVVTKSDSVSYPEQSKQEAAKIILDVLGEI